tara:strand:+ start:38 stop:319 length:282 start_codon:yes stop_codon:yes gene_type:complete
MGTTNQGAQHMKIKFTTSPFERSHGHKPKGYGAWAFQVATHDTAYEAELIGDVEFFTGTFTQARAEARRFFSNPASAVTDVEAVFGIHVAVLG